MVPVGSGNRVGLSRFTRLFARHAGVIDVTRIDGILNAIGPIGRVVGVTRRRNMPIVISNTRDAPRFTISMRSVSYSFFTFDKRGVCNPANVNILCNGRR